MNLSERELFQLLIQRYNIMEESKSNCGRSYKPVQEVLEAFSGKFEMNNNTTGFATVIKGNK